jgi:hypothetical protein
MPPTAQPPQPEPLWKPKPPLKASAWCMAISGLAKNTITAAILIVLKAIVLCLFEIIYVL